MGDRRCPPCARPPAAQQPDPSPRARLAASPRAPRRVRPTRCPGAAGAARFRRPDHIRRAQLTALHHRLAGQPCSIAGHRSPGKSTRTVCPGCAGDCSDGSSTRTVTLCACGSALGKTMTFDASTSRPSASTRRAWPAVRMASALDCGTCTSTRSSPGAYSVNSGCPGATVSPGSTCRQ